VKGREERRGEEGEERYIILKNNFSKLCTPKQLNKYQKFASDLKPLYTQYTILQTPPNIKN
jgi:hypothetical protein